MFFFKRKGIQPKLEGWNGNVVPKNELHHIVGGDDDDTNGSGTGTGGNTGNPPPPAPITGP